MRSGSVVDDQGKLNNYAIEPQMYLQEEARTGFTSYAEIMNGRAAMLGFVSLLMLEFFTGHGLIEFFQNL